MYFQLLAGLHSDIVNHKTYSAGDIVPSDKDLVAAFGSSKFRRLSEQEVAALEPEQECCCMSKCVRTEPVMGDELADDEPTRRVKKHKRIVRA